MGDLTAFGDDPLFRLGGAAVTAGGIATGVVIFLVAWLLSRLASRALCRLRERSTRSAGALYLLEKLAGYGLIVFGAFAGLSAARPRALSASSPSRPNTLRRRRSVCGNGISMPAPSSASAMAQV